ncbi:MAG: IS3 family transposase [Solirubrobacteraceae bacterium]
MEVIRVVPKTNYEAYRSRRMWKALRCQGETAPRCQVERLMAAIGICGAKRRGRPWKTTIADPEDRTVAGPRQPRLHRGRAGPLLGRASSSLGAIVDMVQRGLIFGQP